MRKHSVQQLKQKLFGLICTKIPFRDIENFSKSETKIAKHVFCRINTK